MIEFQALTDPTPTPGLVLRVGDQNSRYLRLTHIFEECVYVMWVNEPEGARYARRPTRMLLKELKKLASISSSTWGRIALPPALSVSPLPESEREQELNSAWLLIEPLTKDFDLETNLTRSRFSYLIRVRSKTMQANFLTTLRMIIRYYYFGRTRLALLPLPPGIRPEDGGYPEGIKEKSGEIRSPKRRGQQAILSEKLGNNDFVVHDEDVSDMIESLKTCLRRGPTYKTTAHEEYLATKFRLRHAEIYKGYSTGQTPELVTARQFSYYMRPLHEAVKHPYLSQFPFFEFKFTHS